MEVNYIIVQAGGRGKRMEYLTDNKPKALVPVDNLPMIFHLFKRFPDKSFFVIGDYKYDVLDNYLATFADVDYAMIDARGKSGTCAGISEALNRIPEGVPFMLTWCDLVLPSEYELPKEIGNYIGISGDFRCRWSYENGLLKEEPSIQRGVAGHFLFADKSEIAEVPEEGEFVRWLCEDRIAAPVGKGIVFKELPLCHTREYGVIAEYPDQKNARCRPFNRIRFTEDRIIKEGIDEQGRTLAVRERAWYKRVKDAGFSSIPVIYETEPLILERIHGKNVFEYDLRHDEKRRVLRELISCISAIHKLDSCVVDQNSYYEAYIGKTYDRLEKVKRLVPFADDEYVHINEKKCRNVFYCRRELEAAVMEYLPTEFCFLHGDCTFSNIMLRDGKEPVLIDPRGYFGFTELYGDPAYDWVKLYYSIVGNYDQFNLGRFRLKIESDCVSLNIASNGWEDMEDDFFEFLASEVTIRQMKLLHAIIYLSLTTYAWEDYDSICGAFYKGLLLLDEAMDVK